MITADGITPDYGFQCGPTFSTTVLALASGREKRNANWAQARHKATAQFASLTQDQFDYLKDLFLQSMGQTFPFLFRDWSDYRADGAQFGVGDGTTKTFQLSKTSKLTGGTPYIRTVRAPDAGVVIKVGGTTTAATVSQTDGSVVFSTAPANGAILTWTGTYHLVMRFANDDLTVTVSNYSVDGYIINGRIDLLECFEDAA